MHIGVELTIIAPISSELRSWDAAVEVQCPSYNSLLIVRLMFPEILWTASANHIRSQSRILNTKPVLPRDSGIWSFFIEIRINAVVAPAASGRCCVGA